ncbi:hypothetical protein J6590_014574 [Homalodisca vitripennis]|nr:hypothetical protein J6590_014574 [Homalodisca vitripennis]
MQRFDIFTEPKHNVFAVEIENARNRGERMAKDCEIIRQPARQLTLNGIFIVIFNVLFPPPL